MSLGALLAQSVFLDGHLIQDSPDVVHELLALPAADHLDALVNTSLCAQIDGVFEFSQLRGDNWLDRVHPFLLIGVIHGKISKFLEHHEHIAGAGTVGLEKGRFAGNQVAALPSLRILEQAERTGNVFKDLVCMRHRLVGAHQLVDAGVGDRADDYEQCKRQRKSRCYFSSEGPIVDHDFLSPIISNMEAK